MGKVFSTKNRYRFVAFSSGFVLMAYELAGARILSPVVGSSTYVWTSIIGVIIAALSVGYFCGGILADKRQKQSDVALLLIVAAAGIISTLLLSSSALQAVSETQIDLRLQAIILSLLLFTPTSIALGALSPYLAKVHTASFEETGRSIATLSALNSLGGIIGTFSVGFIFFGFMGSRETLLVLVGILILSSLVIITKRTALTQLKGTAALVAISALLILTSSNPAGVVAEIETPSSNYQVRDITYGNHPVRVLTMGPGGYQSGIFLNGSDDLVFGYTNRMAQAVAALEQKNRILVLGGGTFTMPEYFAKKYPNSHIDVVEIDPKLPEVAAEYFSYSNPKNVTIYPEDARTYINNSNAKYDAILIDAFSDTGIPFSVTTDEFTKKLSDNLSTNGVVLMNVIAGTNKHCKPLLQSIYSSFSSYMSGSVISVHSIDFNPRQNLLLAFTNTNTNWLEKIDGKKIKIEHAQKLTDNFSPIERLHQNCLMSS